MAALSRSLQSGSKNTLLRSLAASSLHPRLFPSTSTQRKSSTMADLPRTFTMRLAGGKTAQIPSIGYGTWASDGKSPTTPAKPEWILEALPRAFDIGYRHLDTAWFYGVDAEIGQAIRNHGVPREEVFIASKIWNNFYHPDAVELCADKTLKNMQTDYVDLLLLHWPMGFEPISMEALKKADSSNQASLEKKGIKTTESGDVIIDWEHTSEPIAKAAGKKGSIVPTWNAMKELVKKGKARAIGVSNFDVADLKALLPHSQDVPISVNQVEVNPWFQNRELINFSKEHGIVTTCFSPFAGQIKGGQSLLKDEKTRKLAERNGMDVGQLLQSWSVQNGTIPLGKSGNPERMRTNFEVRRLSDEVMKEIDDMEIPGGEGRSIDFTEEWGVKLWQKA